MTLTPVPPQHCTSCTHEPHEHACKTSVDGAPCLCAVCTLPYADHHTTTQRLDQILAAVDALREQQVVLVARVDLALDELLRHNEAVRRVPVLEAAVVALDKRFEDHDAWERDRSAGSNGGGG